MTALACSGSDEESRPNRSEQKGTMVAIASLNFTATLAEANIISHLDDCCSFLVSPQLLPLTLLLSAYMHVI